MSESLSHLQLIQCENMDSSILYIIFFSVSMMWIPDVITKDSFHLTRSIPEEGTMLYEYYPL